MSDLPTDRIQPEQPFTYSGVDFFGPFYIKEGRRESSTVFSKRVLDTLEEGIPSDTSGEKKMGWTTKKRLHWGHRPNQGRRLP